MDTRLSHGYATSHRMEIINSERNSVKGNTETKNGTNLEMTLRHFNFSVINIKEKMFWFASIINEKNTN